MSSGATDIINIYISQREKGRKGETEGREGERERKREREREREERVSYLEWWRRERWGCVVRW